MTAKEELMQAIASLSEVEQEVSPDLQEFGKLIGDQVWEDLKRHIPELEKLEKEKI